MSSSYYYCHNLTGSPVCGPNVTNISNAYVRCLNLTGSPVCGNNVTNMANAYTYCINLTGNPVCGNKVTNMAYAYRNCLSITGSSVCGPKVTNMSGAYYGCSSLSAGNHYWYSKNITSVTECFYNKSNSRRYNIHVPANSKTLNTCLINNTRSLVGAAITWTNAGSYYYNTAYNIYIYPNASMA